MNWQDWITGKYLDFRGNQMGRGGSVSAFARWVGVKQQVMNSWINEGAIPDAAKSINALVDRFGGEVYDILNLTPPIDVESTDIQALQQLAEILKDIPRDRHGDLVFAVRAWATEQGYTIVDLDKK